MSVLANPRGRAGARPLLERVSPALVMAVGAGLALAVILYLGRQLDTFLYDEWNVFINRRAWDLDTLLRPHNEHLVAAPVLIFKLLFATVGPTPYWIYRVVVALLVVALGVLVYLYAVPRIGRRAALVPGLLTILVGPGGEDILWPFQIALALSVLGGIALLLLLDRGTPNAEWWAGGAILLALASSSIGIAVLAAAIVDVLAHPARARRALRLLAVPIVLYGLWYLGYHAAEFRDENVLAAPQYVADAAGGAAGALVGLSREYYVMLAVAFAVLIVWAWTRPGPPPLRLLTVVTMPVAFWLLTAIGRAQDMQPTTSRYLLPGAIFVALVACEALRDVRFSARAVPVAAVLVVFASLSHVAALRTQAHALLGNFTSHVRAEVAALALAREAGPIAPTFRPDTLRAPDIFAGPFFEAVDDLGEPVPDPAGTLSASFSGQRQSADRVFFAALGARVQTVASPVPGETSPTVVEGAPRAGGGGCLIVPGGGRAVMALPADGVAMRTSGPGRPTVGLRRWGSTFTPFDGLDPKVWGVVAIGRDRERERTPILLLVEGAAEVRVCSRAAP
jgi:hypothetical protein